MGNIYSQRPPPRMSHMEYLDLLDRIRYEFKTSIRMQLECLDKKYNKTHQIDELLGMCTQNARTVQKYVYHTLITHPDGSKWIDTTDVCKIVDEFGLDYILRVEGVPKNATCFAVSFIKNVKKEIDVSETFSD